LPPSKKSIILHDRRYEEELAPKETEQARIQKEEKERLGLAEADDLAAKDVKTDIERDRRHIRR